MKAACKALVRNPKNYYDTIRLQNHRSVSLIFVFVSCHFPANNGNSQQPSHQHDSGAGAQHDGSPTYAAYRDLPTGDNETRPLFALRLYDTTAEAGSPDHVRRVAEVIHDRTWRHRSTVGRAAPDRIEVAGLPAAIVSDDEATTADHDEQLARRCRDHYIAEMAARKSAGQQRDWYIPGTFETDAYRFSIQVITRLSQGWENAIDDAGPLKQLRPEDPSKAEADSFGTFLTVSWGVDDDAEVDKDTSDKPLPEIDVSPHQIASLDGCLREMRNRIEWFYNQYVPEGGIDREFEL